MLTRPIAVKSIVMFQTMRYLKGIQDRTMKNNLLKQQHFQHNHLITRARYAIEPTFRN